METGIKSSFIPQDAVTPTRDRPVSRTTFADLLILIGVVLLIASIALSAGVFLYLQYLQTASASKIEQLRRAKEAFDPALIRDITRLDERIRAADKLLSQHIAPSSLFDLLEDLTLQTVAFSDFKYEMFDAQSIKIDMKGDAQSVNSIALQADYLSKSGMIVSPIFSNIGRQEVGVQFNLTASINPNALRYSQRITGVAPAPEGEARLEEPTIEPDTSGFGFPDGALPEESPDDL